MSRQALSSVLSSQASSSVCRTTCTRFDVNLFYFVPLEISLTSWLSTIRCNVKCSTFSSLFGVFRVPDFYVFPAQLWPPDNRIGCNVKCKYGPAGLTPLTIGTVGPFYLCWVSSDTTVPVVGSDITVSCPPIRQYSPGTEVRLQFHLCHVWCCRSLDQLITD